jgi:uncharacterized membrane protein
MKFRKDKDILKFIGFSLSAILIGIIIFLYIQAISIWGFILIIGGVIGMFIVLLVTFKIRQELIEDERTVRAREKAGYYAFWALLYLAGLIMLFRMLKLSPSLTPSFELSEGARHLWLIGVFTFLILRWYYNKKGDAE